MSEFIGSTVGLMATGHGRTMLVRIQYWRESADTIALKSVSGKNLGQIDRAGSKRITLDEYKNRPYDPYNNIIEARWAFSLCGWSIDDEGE